MTKRKQEIIAVSIKILANEGIEALSIRNIANQVGINEASIYRHFESKQDILKSIFSKFQDDLSGIFNSLNELDVSNYERLKAYFYKMCDLIKENNDYYRLVLLEITYFRKVSPEEFAASIKFIRNQILGWIEKAQDSNEIRKDLDKEALVTSIRGTVLAILKHTCIEDYYDVKENSEKQWKLIEELISVR